MMYIEDYLHILVDSLEPEANESTILRSISNQCKKGTALTDRQYALLLEKLPKYKDQYEQFDEEHLKQTRLPLREIDRRKYIKIIEDTIEVRFPFKKSDISKINEIANVANGYNHTRGTHIHTFAYTESSVLVILDRFGETQFEIDQELRDVYKELCEIRNQPERHLSGIIDKKLVNINPALAPIIDTELGSLTDETFVQFVDRRFRYGFDYNKEFVANTNTLENIIATRNDSAYHSKPSTETTDAILTALWKLNRFPLLVILDKLNAEEQLYEVSDYYRDILPTEEQSVLFRIEDTNSGFNHLVKDRKLNNWVDNNTKVVYISKDKLPKLLVKDNWKPSAAFCYNSATDRFVNNYMTFNCDLIVYREEVMSQIRRYSRYYG